MAETLGVVASALTIVEVAVKAAAAISRLKRLYDEIQGIPESIQSLIRQVELLDLFVWDLEYADTTNPILFNDNAIRRSTEFCRKSLVELTELIDGLHFQVNAKKALKRGVAKAKVALKKDVLSNFQNQLQRIVMVLGLAQQNYMIALIRLQPHIVLGHLVNVKAAQRYQMGVVEEEDAKVSFAKEQIVANIGIVDDAKISGKEKYEKATCDSVGPSFRKSGRRPLLPWRTDTWFGSITTNWGVVNLMTNGLAEAIYDTRIQFPRWLACRAWDIQATRATSGWKTNLRAWRLAPDSLAIKAIKCNDKESLIYSLRTGRASAFDRDEAGHTLLHIAIGYNHFEVVEILLAAGLDFIEPNNSGNSALVTFIDRLYGWSTLKRHCFGQSVLGYLASRGAFDTLEEDNAALSYVARHVDWFERHLFEMNDAERSEPLQIYRSHIQVPFHNFDISERFKFAEPYPEYIYLSPACTRPLLYKDGKICKDSIEHGTPVWNFLARFVSTDDPGKKIKCEWQSLLKDLFEAGATSLHNVYDLRHVHASCELARLTCPVTPLFWYIWTSYDCYFKRERKGWKMMEFNKSFLGGDLRKWVSLLKGCNVDLEEYGRQERYILLRNPVLLSYRWVLPIEDYGRGHEVATIRNIQYGANPEDWDIEWSIVGLQSDESEMDQTQLLNSMPGSWPCEGDDDDEERDVSNNSERELGNNQVRHASGILARRRSF
ncbi:hypothetical protein F4781DRAFT_172171 [Annulohypoxylon bovei var. microspora]|nr:hypothetical protein F4781DRAFT_172171 [Annulohypoxylon bovei var. microspora]